MPPLAELPYQPDTPRLFDAISDQPWAVLLDGGAHRSLQSRYDIFAAEPFATLTVRGERTEIRRGNTVEISPDDPLALLRRELNQQPSEATGLPFCGGAIGYFGYDLARRWHHLSNLAANPEPLPEMAIGIYDWAVVVDHHERRSWLVGAGRDPRTAEIWPALRERYAHSLPERSRAPFHLTAPLASNFTPDSYATAFRRIQHYIDAGDCYQVNLAQCFAANACGDPWLSYQALRVLNPAPFAAYLHTPDAHILSSSPERFLRVRNGLVETRPIKGTRARAGHPRLDAEIAAQLRVAEKDRAENLMIVDLLRNDLSKTCNMVRVPKLFEVESYATVHHLVSTVTGMLRPGADAIEVMRHCFPGGSVTGAPKLRAMQIIDELEPHRRGVYCGAIGYIGFNGEMDTSIAIRILAHSHGTIRLWAGGAIVADSILADEYQETFDKAAALLQTLQQGAANDFAG